jgi:L-ascorbate metabolism protein UlaG (beta-lactamase superfamily)
MTVHHDSHEVDDRRATISWLGQAGFIIAIGNRRIAIDPYLSDYCAEIHGLQRNFDAPVSAKELTVSTVLISHWHEDHFDLPTIETAMSRGCQVIAPASCLARLAGKGLDVSNCVAALPGKSIVLGDVTITPVPADHRVAGFLTEDAVGYLISTPEGAIYHSGDTAYTRTIVESMPSSIDVALVCMNGSGGNMNTIESAALSVQLHAKVVVPMHFGLWADEAYGEGATLDPHEYERYYRGLGGSAEVNIPSISKPLAVELSTAIK